MKLRIEGTKSEIEDYLANGRLHGFAGGAYREITSKVGTSKFYPNHRDNDGKGRVYVELERVE